MNRKAAERRLRSIEAMNEATSGGDALEAARRAVAIDDTFGGAWLLLAAAHFGRNELAEGQEACWKALRLSPTLPMCYFTLSSAMQERGDDPDAAHYLAILALRSCATGERIPEEIVKRFSDLPRAEEFDPRDPDLYAALADSFETKLPEGVAPRMPDDLAPFDLLLKLCVDADDFDEEAARDLLERIRATPDCVPVFQAALRDAGGRKDGLRGAAIGLIAAVLGEMGGPEVAPDLFEWCGHSDSNILAHVNWAIWRLGQRLPRETLAAIVEATPSAVVPIRCALAEQLGLLPKSVDAEAALRGMLAGDSSSAEAAYVVVAVSDALARRGHRSASKTAYTEGLEQLDPEGRRWAKERVRKRDFTPKLIDDDIANYTIEEVFSERLLMDEGEDDEEFDQDDELPPAERPGRNDPCWCGSGKKYKKCHLASDEEVAPESDYVRLLERVIEGALKWYTQADMDAARELYFGPYQQPELDEEQAPAFFDWLVRDFRSRSSGKTAVEEFLRRRGHELTASERSTLESWRDSRFGLFEVQRVQSGEGVELKDYFTEDRFFVHDKTASAELVRWDCTVSRIETLQGRHIFSGNGLMIPRPLLPRLLEFIEKERGDRSPSEFVRANAHRVGREVRGYADAPLPVLQNTDGEELEFSAATYEVLDEAALLAALRALDELQEHEPQREFVWTGNAGLGADTALGRIEIGGGKLKLDCNSRTRLARGKRLLETAAGKSIRYLRDSYETVAAARARTKSEPASPAPRIDPEVERRIVLEAQARHYATWPDRPLPALGGITPRAAMATREGRKAVLELIRSFENGAERERKEGRPAFDFSALRKELGLTPE